MKLKNVSHYSRFLLDGQLFRWFVKETLRTALINCERWVAFFLYAVIWNTFPGPALYSLKFKYFIWLKLSFLFIFIKQVDSRSPNGCIFCKLCIWHGHYWTMQTLNLNLACYGSLYIKILLLWLAKWECCKYLGTKWKSTTVITRPDCSFNRNNVIMKAILC